MTLLSTIRRIRKGGPRQSRAGAGRKHREGKTRRKALPAFGSGWSAVDCGLDAVVSMEPRSRVRPGKLGPGTVGGAALGVESGLHGSPGAGFAAFQAGQAELGPMDGFNPGAAFTDG